MHSVLLVAAAFLASAVEMVEALTIVLAVGVTRGWRSAGWGVAAAVGDIAAAAVRALEWDAFVPIEKLDVTVSKGWVTLKGEVEWQFQKEDAEKDVRRLTGVKGVINSINVSH